MRRSIIVILVLLGTLTLIILKIILSSFITSIRFEYLFILITIFIVIPYLKHIEAFGVKFEIRKRVEYLDKIIAALPDYIVGSDYYNEKDYELAKESFNKCLDIDRNFWPAELALGAIAQDENSYNEAIKRYNNILNKDKNNIYALNNLADVYVDSPSPYLNPSAALEKSDRVLKIVSNLGSAVLIKSEALIKLNRFEEALPLLQYLLDENKIPTQKHWVLYALAIVNSNVGKKLAASNINKMYLIALDNNEGEYFLNTLKEELNRFMPKDQSIILRYLRKKKL